MPEALLVLAVLIGLWQAWQGLQGIQRAQARADMAARAALFVAVAADDGDGAAAEAHIADDLSGGWGQDFGVLTYWRAGQARVQPPAQPVWLHQVLPADWTARLVLLDGHGAGQDDAAVQTRIAHAQRAWGAVAAPSQRLARRLNTVLQRVDAPWRAPHDAAAWLHRWAGEAPSIRRREGGAQP